MTDMPENNSYHLTETPYMNGVNAIDDLNVWNER